MYVLYPLILVFSLMQNPTTPPLDANQDEWTLLFNGTDFEGWHRFNRSEMSPAWTVEDGAMKFNPTEARNYGDGGHNIVTDAEFTNFELSIEWKISKKGNSGIFWGVQEGEAYGEPYLTGPEIQVLDNERHPDAFNNPKYHQAGALYDIVQPSQDVCKPAEEWNHFLIHIDHNKNEGFVKLNGTEIIRFPVHGQAWEDLIADCKFRNRSNPSYTEAPDFGTFKTGKISLQDHGDVVYYRNIKIREL